MSNVPDGMLCTAVCISCVTAPGLSTARGFTSFQGKQGHWSGTGKVPLMFLSGQNQHFVMKKPDLFPSIPAILMLHKVGGNHSLGARWASDQPHNLPRVLPFYPIQIYFFFLELLLEGKHLDLTVV